jgi:DNA-directed RNA polymerase specialized sigma24 family protein
MTTESQPRPDESPRRAVARPAFCTTRWTQVCLAKADSDEGRRALGELCEAYYDAVLAFLRYELRDAEAAREVTHEFFARVLAGDAFVHAERTRGRFRSYLLGAVKHFLSHHRESALRKKRGGDVERVSLDDDEAGARSVPDARLSPDAAFDQQWALTVLARALAALRQEFVGEGRADLFERVKPWLTGDAAHGEQTAQAAAAGTSANAFKVAVHRAKRRFRELVKAEIAGTLESPDMVEEEMRALFAALGS